MRGSPPVAEVPAGSAVLPGSCRCGLLRKSTYRDTDGDCFASRDIGSTASQERESACSLRKVLVDARAAARVIGPSLLDVRGISDPARRALAGGPSAASPTGLAPPRRPCSNHSLDLSDSPIENAFCRVAPSVLFNFRAIFAAPVFLRASVFSSRTSLAVHDLSLGPAQSVPLPFFPPLVDFLLIEHPLLN
jgi:hypothetical protein